MPIIRYPDDPPLSTLRPVDYEPATEEQEIDPGAMMEIGSAFRQGNLIGSALNNKLAGIDRSEPEDGFTGDIAWKEIEGTRYARHWPRFAPLLNRRAFSAMKAQIDMEDEDRRILDAGGWSSVAAQFGAAAFDLPSLIPGGTVARGLTRGATIARTALSTGAAGALAAGVSELGLQATQVTRPLSESVINVGSGAVLGTMLGAGAGALVSRAQQRAAMDLVDRVMKEPVDDVAALAEYRQGVAEGVGAAAVDRPVLEDYDIASGAKAIGKAQAGLNPLLRAAHSPSAVHRSIIADLAETGYYLEKNTRGEGNLAVESAVKFWDRGALAKGLTDVRKIYTEARKGGLQMTPEQFRIAVSKAMRRGDEGEHEAVSQAAKVWRSRLFDPLKDQAIEVGMLAPDVHVTTATSYLSRLWHAPRLNAGEAKFKAIVRPWLDEQLRQLEFKAHEIGIGNKIVDAEKLREAFEKVDDRVANVERRLAGRTESRARKVNMLESLRTDRQAVLKERAPKELVSMLRGADENAAMVDAVKEARKGNRAAGRKQSAAERQPVLALIRKKGGVRVGSKLDGELRAMGVTPQTHPGLFKAKGGLGDIDNFVKNEDDIFAALPDDDSLAEYVDPRALYEAIRSELAGDPLRSPDDLAAAEIMDSIDRVASEWLEKVDLPANATVKDVRDFINRVLAAEKNTAGIDSRISKLERELDEFDAATDALTNERNITGAEAKDVRERLDALEKELDGVKDLADASPRVSLVVDYATTRRDIFKLKLQERSLSRRVDAIKRLEAEGNANDEILAELAAKEIDLGRLQSNIAGLKVKADKLEPMVPKVRQEIPDFVSPEDRADYVNGIANDIFVQLTGRARVGMPSYDITMAARGPLKERTFNIPDHLVEDFLEHDIELIARRYARVMAADVELARMDRRLGGPGKADLKGQIERVRGDYLALRDAVTASDAAPEAKEAALLAMAKREKSDVEDLGAVRDLLRGQYAVDSQHTNFARVLRVAGTFNFLRTLGGVVVSSLGDAVRPIMVNGMLRYMGEGIVPLITNLQAFKLAVADAKLIGAVVERVLQSRIATMAELADPYASNSPFERLIDNMGNMFAKATFLPHWNDLHKSIASVLTQNHILKNALADFGGLAAGERSYMGFVGIDRDMADRIAKQFKAHGSVEGNVHVPGIEQWDDDAARRAFAAAVNKDVDGTIVTKGVADVPLFAHTPVGRSLLQFKTFAIASNQRVLMRGMQESTRSFFQGVALTSAFGMLAYWLKQKESGRDLSNNPGTWIAEGLERSGIFSIAFEINNIFEKLGGPGVFALGATAGQAFNPNFDKRQPASRYVNRDAFGSLLGPTFQLGTDTAQLLGIPARGLSGDLDLTPADINRMTGMIPFYTLPYWRWFFEGGFGLKDNTTFKGVEPELKELVN